MRYIIKYHNTFISVYFQNKKENSPNIFFTYSLKSKLKSFYGIDMFDPIISRFTDKTYIHKMGKHGIKVESSFFPTKKEVFRGFISSLFGKWRRYQHLMKIFLSLLVQIDFPRIINFLIPSFYIFSSISTFYIVFYSSWARSNNIFLRQCLLKDLFDPYNNFLFFVVSHMIAYLSSRIVISSKK